MILITRPFTDAGTTAEEIQALGIDTLICPLFAIEIIADQSFNPADDYDVFIFTSKNALRAYHQNYAIFDKQIFTVGKSSAELAASLGFQKIINSDDDVNALVVKIKASIPDKSIKLVHFCGEETAGELSAELTLAGINCTKKIIYKKVQINQLPTAVITQIKNKVFSGAVFLSPQTAEIFVNLVIQHGLNEAFSNCSAFCISSNTSMKLSALKWQNIYIADSPNRLELINKIAEVCNVKQ